MHLSALFFVVALFLSGCSSSSDPDSNMTVSELVSGVTDDENSIDGDTDNGGDLAADNPQSDSDAESVDLPADASGAATRRVNFIVTVPAYQSNALQLQVEWGDITLFGNWIADEQWQISDEFPADTENRLIVSFYDQNEAIILGRYEADFKTGVGASQTVVIAADQFDIRQWDDDNDGTANLDELIAGSNPLVNEEAATSPPEPVQATLSLFQNKTFRISWPTSSSASFYRVLENPDGVSGFTQIGDDIAGTVQQYDHRVAFYRRINASYIVQACSNHSCADSQAVKVPESLSQAVGYFKATTDDPRSFGWQVAISADGNTMATVGTDVVYVFSRINGTWEQQAQLDEIAALNRLDYKHALSLSGNGDVLVVGAPAEKSAAQGINGDQNDNSRGNEGAVYLY